MPLVMLRAGSSATFRRYRRNEKGEITKTLEFPPGEPVDVDWDDMELIEGDFYKALLPTQLENGKPRIIPEDIFRKEYSTIANPDPEPDPGADPPPTDTTVDPANPEIKLDATGAPITPEATDGTKPGRRGSK